MELLKSSEGSRASEKRCVRPSRTRNLFMFEISEIALAFGSTRETLSLVNKIAVPSLSVRFTCQSVVTGSHPTTASLLSRPRDFGINQPGISYPPLSLDPRFCLLHFFPAPISIFCAPLQNYLVFLNHPS